MPVQRNADKLANFKLKQTYPPPILSKEITSLYVCPVKDPQSIPVTKGNKPGMDSPVTCCYWQGKGSEKSENYSSLKNLLANYGRPSEFNLPQTPSPFVGNDKGLQN